MQKKRNSLADIIGGELTGYTLNWAPKLTG